MFDPDVVSAVIDKILQNNRLLGDLFTPENKAVLLNNSLIRPVAVGDVLCQQGQIEQTLYLIIQGEVEVRAQANSDLTSMAKLGGGELVGEISALFAVPRIANVIVTQPSVVLEISANVFWGILRENSFAKDEIVRRCKKRIIETSLRCVPLFSGLNNQSMNELSGLSSLIKAEKDSIVAHEGKVERSMYVICSGTARVYITLNGKPVTVALLHPGDYFGEYSLFSGDERSASVVAVTGLQLVQLKGEAFQDFIDYNQDVGEEINIIWAERKNELEELRGSYKYRDVVEERLKQIQQMLDAEIT